ncbi:MAG: hypothetical protein WCC69_06105 [Pirellulales bacterium]
MHRSPVRAALTWGLVATLLLPVVLAVVLGLGSLLNAVGDEAGSRACSRVALAAGAAWLVAVVATTTVSAVALLERPSLPRHGRRKRARRAGERHLRGIGPETGERVG